VLELLELDVDPPDVDGPADGLAGAPKDGSEPDGPDPLADAFPSPEPPMGTFMVA